MRITEIETIYVDRYLFVRVHTDAGITGLGESGAWGFLEASASVVETFKRYLIGQDPLRIEHHWQYLYRWTHFRGAAIMGALSAIDIALWDIAGKHFGAPVHQLLGGPTRDKARVYFHVFGSTREELVRGCVEAKEQGFTAVGHLTPFTDDDRNEPFFATHAARMGNAIETVRQYREAVGDAVDLCIEIHRQLTPAEAVVLARGIEQYHPYFYEDPTLPDNFDDMAQIADHVEIPIATGERLHTISEFEMLLARGAVQYVRPDVCMCGGITGAKKIAALAEARHVGVVPHNPLSPVSTAACLQLAACIPNFALQEYPLGEHEPPKSEMVRSPIKRDGGYLLIPTVPGIGIELADDAAERFPYKPRQVVTRLHADGSVVDQ
ncbi:MAG TPA: galactonate dehydratase [Mycobacteriales bacterium]|nr:galactonate dehydratase [Mycobacteriales bacterium]